MIAQIKNIQKNALFSDAFAMNNFFTSINDCLKTKWDNVVNYSNDEVGAFICSMLTSEQKHGTTISKLGSPVTSNAWASYQNFACQDRNKDVISKTIIRHHLTNTPYHREGTKVKINEEYSLIANQNFAKIRQSKGSDMDAKIIGISLVESYSNKRLNLETLINTVELIEESESFKTVLLLSGKPEEKQIINELNKHFENSLISINTDSNALSAVLANLDLFISMNNID